MSIPPQPFQRHHAQSDRVGQAFAPVSASPPILRVEELIKIYSKRRVVDGVSFHVNHGEIVGLLGPNGAGKTTSFSMACGLIETNGGIVYLDGRDVTNWPMYRRCREGGMGYLAQQPSVFRNLSVQDNLLGVMEMLGMKRRVRKARCEELLEKFKLTHLRKNRGSSLSGGERRRLEIARALVSEPKIMLLDEPFAAIDPITVNSIQEIILHLAKEGISILITDHSVDDTLEITDRSYIISSGKVLCHGTPAEVLANEEARNVYFGPDAGNSTILHQQSASRIVSSRTASPRDPGYGENPASSSSIVPFVRPRPKPPETSRKPERGDLPDRSPPSGRPHPSRPVPGSNRQETEQRPPRPLVRGNRHEDGISHRDSAHDVLPDGPEEQLRLPRRPSIPPRPAVRSISREDRSDASGVQAPSLVTASTESVPPPPTPSSPDPTSSGFMTAVNTFLWGNRKKK